MKHCPAPGRDIGRELETGVEPRPETDGDWSDCGETLVQAKPGGVTEQQCIVGVAVQVCRY